MNHLATSHANRKPARKLAFLVLALFGLMSLRLTAAPIQDLEIMLKNVSEDFRKVSQNDQAMANVRAELLSADTSAERKQALFTQYKKKLAGQLEKHHELLKTIRKAMDAAEGIPDGTPANMEELLSSFEADMIQMDNKLGHIQATAVALSRKDGLPGKIGKMQAANIDMLRKQMQIIADMRKSQAASPAPFGMDLLKDMLKSLQVAALTRENSLMFEFTITAQNAEIHNYMTEVRSLYDQLIGPQDFANYIRDITAHDIETANHLIQMAQMLATADLGLPVITEEDFEAAMDDLEGMEQLMPYDVEGTFYFFDNHQDRWYIMTSKGDRQYLPVDPGLSSGRYVKMHDDGYIYSEAPWYDEPKQLTFTSDWKSEISVN